MLITTDQRNLISKLTIRRFINAVKLYVSFFLSKWLKKNWHSGMPMSIAIEPTTSCNLRCPECPSGLRSFSRPTGQLQQEFFKEVIGQLSKHTFYLTFYFQGEPYLNPNFLDMVRYASSLNIYTSTSTNAHYLTEEKARLTVQSGLDRLIISIDGTTQQTYASYRVGGKLDKVIEGTKNIIQSKKELQSRTPYIVFQFLVVKPNEHQIDEVKQLAEELGVDDIVFKTAQIYDYENGSELIPTIDKYSRYKKLPNGKYAIKNKLENNCWKMWHSPVITWDGKVVPCCFDKDASHSLGTVGENDFETIWKGKPYQQFRNHLLHSRASIDICRNCTEGMNIYES